MVWQFAHNVPKKIRQALSKYNDFEAQLLFNRGITSNLKADKYFNPKLEDPSSAMSLPGIQSAGIKILESIAQGKKIFIYGDYDVDGICSTSILFDFLYRKLKTDVIPYIPDRFEEGYGLNKIGLDHILSEKGQLVITVDCGIRDKVLVEEYSKKGLEFIITDHHSIPLDKKGKFDLPTHAKEIVHPQLGKYAFPQICATAVVWKLIQVLNELISRNKSPNKLTKNISTWLTKLNPPKDLLEDNEYIDLVSLATICDIMPLEGENRNIVFEGIKSIKKNVLNRGLLKLLEIARVDQNSFDSYHFGFILGPRLNAAGRMDHALNGVRLFTSHNPEQINMLALKLDSLNIKRQVLTESMLKEGLIEAEKQVAAQKKLIFVSKENWSEGIVGLVAGRLNEKYYLPVLAASSKNGIVRGSARSVVGFDITLAISESGELLERFGGHSQAAGFTLQEKNLAEFIKKIQSIAESKLTDEIILKALEIEAELKGQDINVGFVESLDKFKPFGNGNKEPVFVIKNISIAQAPMLMGAKAQHIKFTAMTPDDVFFEVIAFNQAEKYSAIINLNKRYDIAGTFTINEWRGNKIIQLKLKDILVVNE